MTERAKCSPVPRTGCALRWWEPERPGTKSLWLLPSGSDQVGDSTVRPTPAAHMVDGMRFRNPNGFHGLPLVPVVHATRHAHGEGFKVFAQHDLTRQPGRPRQTCGQVEHVVLIFARRPQAVEISR